MKKRIPLNADAQEAMQQQLQAFRDKFGREPGPNDPVFFDPECDTPTTLTPERMEELMRRDLRAQGVSDAEIDKVIAYLDSDRRPMKTGPNGWEVDEEVEAGIEYIVDEDAEE